MATGFDVEAARKAGYSDDEILNHLTQTRQFDVNGALKSGYSKQEVINYLASAPAPSSNGLTAQQSQSLTNFLKTGQKPSTPATFTRTPMEQTNVAPRTASEQVFDTLGNTVAGTVRAVTAPPQGTTEQVLSAGAPELLFGKRVGIDPQVAEWQKANQTEGWESFGHRLASVIPVVGPMAAAAGENFGKGEGPAGLLNTYGAIAGAHGVGETSAKLPDASEAVIPRGNQAKVMPEAGKLPIKAQAGAEDIFRASAPTGMNKGFRSNVYAAAGDLADIGRKINLSEAKGGIITPDMRVRATVDAIRDHLNDMYQQERVPQIQRNADSPVKVGTNLNTQRGLEYVEGTAGDVADAQLARKALDGGTLTVAEADRLAQVVNQTLKTFEKATPEGKMQLQTTNPKIGGLKALDSELSNNLNQVLTNNGEVGLRGYERRYAGLSAIRDQLESRMNSVELHQPGMVKAVVEPVARVMSGGKTGLASASQAATADVNIGRILQRGFQRLTESGITAGRQSTP